MNLHCVVSEMWSCRFLKTLSPVAAAALAVLADSLAE